MATTLFVWWAIVGWCGTRWGRWPPPPPPDPEPWLLLRLIGVIGGIAGGWAFVQAFGPQPEPPSLLLAAATAVGAFAGGRLLGDIYGLATAGRRGPRS